MGLPEFRGKPAATRIASSTHSKRSQQRRPGRCVASGPIHIGRRPKEIGVEVFAPTDMWLDFRTVAGDDSLFRDESDICAKEGFLRG
jgi:hypothetical protein